MIRPITLVCWILALSAGLYLYHAKHEVELIDQHIDLIAKQTAALRVESRGLLDEWIRLGEPEQLHKYSDEYLGLQPIAPGQFARLSDLPARLPPPQPDPPDDQADVMAQSSGGGAVAVGSPENQPPGDQVGAIQVTPAEAATVGPVGEAGANDIPVPPIPPATVPVAAASGSGGAAVPLQARPVSPRLADGQLDPEAARAHAAAASQAADEPHAGVVRLTPATAGEPHQQPQGTLNAQGPVGQPHGLPPLQAQGAREASGLPPLQAQASTREVAQGTGRGPAPGRGPGGIIGPAPGQSAVRQTESRMTDNRLNEPLREIRPIEPQPGPRQASEPRDAGGQYGRQGQGQTEQAQAAPAQGGSLLGMSRGSVPPPLPAPTPVNANWSGPAGPLGSGR